MADLEDSPEAGDVGVGAPGLVAVRPAGIAAVGATVLELLAAGRALLSVFIRTLYFVLRGVPQPGAVTRQMYEIGNRSLVFLCVVMGFIGMIFVYQSGLQIKRVMFM